MYSECSGFAVSYQRTIQENFSISKSKFTLDGINIVAIKVAPVGMEKSTL